MSGADARYRPQVGGFSLGAQPQKLMIRISLNDPGCIWGFTKKKANPHNPSMIKSYFLHSLLPAALVSGENQFLVISRCSAMRQSVKKRKENIISVVLFFYQNIKFVLQKCNWHQLAIVGGYFHTKIKTKGNKFMKIHLKHKVLMDT